MAASKPTCQCFKSKKSLDTKLRFKDLSLWSGLFPSWLMAFASQVRLQIKKKILLIVLLISKKFIQHSLRLISALPILFYLLTYYLNSFRRKPAITRSALSFTSNQKSSEFYATNNGSVLKIFFEIFSTCSWLNLLVSGLIHLTKKVIS